MFKPRTEPVKEGTLPYVWNIPSVYQCVWYCYYRCLEIGFSPCEWFDRATQTGSYTNAKDWLKEYRDPWEVKNIDYTPVAGDILVYGDEPYGHVIFCETDVMTSEYRSGDPDSFRNAKIGDYHGTLIGILHYPYEPVLPVERDETRDQIQTTDESLRIRVKPSLDAEIVGHVQLGYYNVFDKKDNDGYTWYQIAKGRWCANITTKFLPASGEDDAMKKIVECLKVIQGEINTLNEQNNKYKEKLNEIHKLSEVD